ncbi:UNVERIFIED_CONTAM: hypothetical protein Sindi_2680300 [Sesamum indicum]
MVEWPKCASRGPSVRAARDTRGPMLNIAVWNIWGLNKRDHQLAVKDIIVEFRALHESISITIVYGATEVPDRRALWGSLESLTLKCVDTPWLVGGDFNAVRDVSEVCGTSGDIRLAMEEFNTCIQNAVLLPLLMQGEWYTWHNMSDGPHNLWKRLDRMLTNDIRQRSKLVSLHVHQTILQW